ncbi:phosphopantetheine-binding protein [Streptomyces sp. NPDC093097]|uniref:phosphopantetheine-binding protein n=1 Tax=Streptomyces sp. NPDC093097 TaxID=3366027 RepID=UPI00381CE04D
MTTDRSFFPAGVRWWLEGELAAGPDQPAAGVPFSVAIDGPLDVPVLECALEDLAAQDPGTGNAVVGQPFPLDYAASDPARRERLAADRTAVFVRSPGPAGREPPLRAELLRLGEHRFRLLVAPHNATSADPFLSELAAVYERLARAASSVPGGTQEVVARVWEQVLERPVGATENFFEAGGNSVQLLRLHEGLQTALGRRVELVDLFRYPTIQALTAFLTAEHEQDGIATAGSRVQEHRTALHRLSRRRGFDDGGARRTPPP